METINQDLKVEALRFGYGQTKLGLVLVALSDCGVTAILLGDDRQKLWRELKRELPWYSAGRGQRRSYRGDRKGRYAHQLTARWLRLSARSPWLGAGACSMGGTAGDPTG